MQKPEIRLAVHRLDAEKRGHVGGDADQKTQSGQECENDYVNWNFPLAATLLAAIRSPTPNRGPEPLLSVLACSLK